ncbi:MAG: GTP-binding protein [Solobacterium sp.]|nr:GTP-binding protein [Solobacterium sp.]
MTKVNVISGFLGAGKTTLIQKLLKDVFAGKQVVLVENEFGAIGIDGGFLQETGIEIAEINAGCICCTLKGDFEGALKTLNETYHPDHIIIEPSGVGKLSDILRAIQSVEGLELDSYSTVVDGARCKIYHKNFKEFFDDQIATANCVILSKTQELSEEKLQEDLDIIRELNPNARIITTPWDELSGQAIFDAMVGATDGFPELEDDHDHEHEHEHEHDHDHEHEHHHDHDHEHEHEDHEHEHHHEHDDHDDHEEHHHHHHEHEDVNEGLSEGNRIRFGEETHEHHHHHGHDADEIFDSIGIETINKYTQEEIKEALSKLDEHVVRAKGIVPSPEESWLFFDYVPGSIDIREGAPAYTGLITVIGEHLDVHELKEIFGVH